MQKGSERWNYKRLRGHTKDGWFLRDKDERNGGEGC